MSICRDRNIIDVFYGIVQKLRTSAFILYTLSFFLYCPFKHRNKPVLAYMEPWVQGNGLNKFHPSVILFGNPICALTHEMGTLYVPWLMRWEPYMCPDSWDGNPICALTHEMGTLYVPWLMRWERSCIVDID